MLLKLPQCLREGLFDVHQRDVIGKIVEPRQNLLCQLRRRIEYKAVFTVLHQLVEAAKQTQSQMNWMNNGRMKGVFELKHTNCS